MLHLSKCRWSKVFPQFWAYHGHLVLLVALLPYLTPSNLRREGLKMGSPSKGE